ncbi:hypothetical protein C0995_015783 [Termitomyces sp. Mi166|nr:hypothetical protein C0995_015783 [Termitomyces sp. Mi166\
MSILPAHQLVLSELLYCFQYDPFDLDFVPCLHLHRRGGGQFLPMTENGVLLSQHKTGDVKYIVYQLTIKKHQSGCYV